MLHAATLARRFSCGLERQPKTSSHCGRAEQRRTKTLFRSRAVRISAWLALLERFLARRQYASRELFAPLTKPSSGANSRGALAPEERSNRVRCRARNINGRTPTPSAFDSVC